MKKMSCSSIFADNADLDEYLAKFTILYDDELYDNKMKKYKNKKIILPKIIHEVKNNIYIAKFPDGTKEVNILKPNHGDEYDLEKGLLYYVIKKNLDLGKVLEWMKPLLDKEQKHEDVRKHQKYIKGKINKWFFEKNANSIDDKECQKLINNMDFFIENQEYFIKVNISKNGIIGICDKKKNEPVIMIKNGFPHKGFLRHLIYKLYNEGRPSLEYYQLKKLTYKFYKGCFDSIESKLKE